MPDATTVARCRCPNGGRPNPSYRNGQPAGSCVQCSRDWQPWLTPEFIREFFERAALGAPDLADNEVATFATYAASRALGVGQEDYGLHGFLERDLQGEPEAELLDTGNYAVFQAIKGMRAVELGEGDKVKAEEDYALLLGLTVETMRLFSAWRRFWSEH